MDHKHTGYSPESLRLVGAALALQQVSGTAAQLVPLPGTDRVVVIGTAAEVARLLLPEPAPAVSEQADEKWLPTPENVNALPDGVRQYVHDLETRCDPAGEVAALTGLRDQLDAVQIMYRKAADTLAHGASSASADRNAVLEEAALAAEKVQDDYCERQGGKWPELRDDAETGARDCASAIRDLKATPASAPQATAGQAAMDAQLRQEVVAMYQLLDDGEWAEHLAVTLHGQCLETAITRLVGRAAGAPQAQVQRAAKGWQIVPAALTEEMHIAIVRAVMRSHGNADCPPNVWAAALAAAPQPIPAQPGMPASAQPADVDLVDSEGGHAD